MSMDSDEMPADKHQRNDNPTASAIGWIVVLALLKVFALLLAAGWLLYVLTRIAVFITMGGHFG